MTVTVVVIEDEPATRELIVGYLTRRGNRVTGWRHFRGGGESASCPATPMSLALDVGLPDGNGADFCLDNVARLPHAKWLIMSAQSEMVRHARTLMKRYGAPPFSVFDKPVPFRALDDVIRQAMFGLPPMRSSAAD